MIELMSQQLLGDVRSVLIDFGFVPRSPVPARLFDPALAGGTVLDIGIYNVFTAMSILGKPDSIEASMTPASTGIDEQCAVLFKYKNGAMAQLFSSFATHLPTEAEISGTKGRIKLTHRFYTPEASIEYYPAKMDSKEIIEFDNPRKGFGYEYEARHVCECLRKGLTESPVIPLSETIERMQVLDEIRKKAGIRYSAD
jgi:predicted dehydrogenase